MNRFAKFMRDYSVARFLIPLGVVLIAFGAVMFGIIAKQIGYKKVDSTISRIELYEEEHTEGDTHYDTTYTTYVKYTVDGKEYPAITNLGVRPTVSDDGSVCAETYVYDYSGDLYGKNVTVKLLQFRRSEQKFSSVDDLFKTVDDDFREGRIYHGIGEA